METQVQEKKEDLKSAGIPRSVIGGACLCSAGLLFVASGSSVGNLPLVGVGVTMILVGALLFIKRPR
jgi:hypothetical protein